MRILKPGLDTWRWWTRVVNTCLRCSAEWVLEDTDDDYRLEANPTRVVSRCPTCQQEASTTTAAPPAPAPDPKPNPGPKP